MLVYYKAGFGKYSFLEPTSGKSGDKIKQSSLYKKSEIPDQNDCILLYKLFMFYAGLASDSRGKPRGETEEEGGVLEYDSPSCSKDSEEESFANNNDEPDHDVSGEIPSLSDFTGSKGLFDDRNLFNFDCCKSVLKGSLNLISQPFFRLNPSPSNEIEKKKKTKQKKKKQSRLFIVTSSFKTQLRVSLLFLELVLPSNRDKCLLLS